MIVCAKNELATQHAPIGISHTKAMAFAARVALGVLLAKSRMACGGIAILAKLAPSIAITSMTAAGIVFAINMDAPTVITNDAATEKSAI
jgi:hypothetical protein